MKTCETVTCNIYQEGLGTGLRPGAAKGEGTGVTGETGMRRLRFRILWVYFERPRTHVNETSPPTRF